MSNILKRQKILWGLVIALGTTAAVITADHLGLLERAEWITYDQRVRLFRAESELHPDVAVVLIDEASLQAMNPLVGRWPWPRSVYADVVEFMAMGGARAVVFDILLPENEAATGPDGTHLTGSDQRLIEIGADTGMVYHAAQLIREELDDGRSAVGLNTPLPEAFSAAHAVPIARQFPDRGNNSYILPFDGLYQTARGIGVVGVDADADGVYRRLHLFHTYRDQVFPALSTAPLLDSLGPEKVVFAGDKLLIDDIDIPLDRHGRYLVNMVHKTRPYSISGILSSIQRLRSGDIENMLVFPDEFEDKIVFIGASAVGLADTKATPLSPKTPGVMLHASAITNILNRDFLIPVPLAVTYLLVLLLAFATTFPVLASQRLLLQSALPVAIGALFTGWALWRFGAGTVYAMVPPLAAVGIAWLGTFTYLTFTEGRDKRRVRTMLGQYVSPAVLSEVMDRYEDQLKAEVGTQEHLSILFSDVRGFTSISEKLEARQVVELLNIHFSVMSEVIFRYQGTLDKFIGDAIMAFWGAPIRVDDHADRAVCAAIEMARSVRIVNDQLSERGYPNIAVGIGINTGDMILGNIGSERKLDYTVIGDHVNLGSRLEGLTKPYGAPVLISEFTKKELRMDIPCGIVDLVRVKGKQVPIGIYWPFNMPDDPPEEIAEGRNMAELLEKAFASYERRDWKGAIELYSQLPEDMVLRETFITRCQEYLNTPPPEEWDGVFTLTTK